MDRTLMKEVLQEVSHTGFNKGSLPPRVGPLTAVCLDFINEDNAHKQDPF